MRIMFIVGGGAMRGGGSATIGTSLLAAAVRDGHSASVVCPDEDRIIALARELGCDHEVCPDVMVRSFGFWRLPALVRLIRRHRPQVVYTHYTFPPRAMLRLAARLAGVPAVVHVFTNCTWNSNPAIAAYQRRLDSWTARLPGRTVAASHSTQAQLADAGTPDDRISLIPFGVNADEVAGTSVGLPVELATAIGDRGVVACVGFIEPNKNQVDAVEAFARAAGEDNVLVLAGPVSDAGYSQEVRAAAAAHGVSDRVLFAGDLQRSEVFALLRRTSVVLAPSRSEGLGIAALEAAAAGAPVIGYARSGGLLDVIDHGRTGFLVEGVDEAADSLTRLLGSETLRDEMSTNAREWVRENFSFDDRSSELMRACEKVIG